MTPLDQSASDAAAHISSAVGTSLLVNPIWNALTTEERGFALGSGLARRFPAEMGPLSGLAEQNDTAYEALRTLIAPNGAVALFLEAPPVPRPGWTLVRGGLMSQMLWSGSRESRTVVPDPPALLRQLTPDDVPAMLELAHLTEPGPFGPRTHELGTFFGIFESGRLLAMAGQRLQLPGLVEVSAVCTHPDARGRGYARTLMSHVMADILRHGETPFLHVFADNYSAIRVYDALGFVWRRSLHLAVLKST